MTYAGDAPYKTVMGIQDLFRVIENYRVARGVSDARVSTLVFNDGAKIADLRAGRDIGARRLERAIGWFPKTGLPMLNGLPMCHARLPSNPRRSNERRSII